ncbi:hypothetical protein [Colwellia echini]|uniref:Glycosyl transferase family 1 domain-containing protein n=1 Tax=Colwellia echini TaxID=1982103 RepID=A0ABY3MVT6_9GAMM|nr:hypothetical protein [Colwellia echini]TYK65326.1 hypothetical protein CWS31_010685 [Colwellia echini]
MQSPRVFLVDPHMTDEVFTPLRFFIRKRRGLKKYSYFKEICSGETKVNIAQSCALSGVIPANLFSNLPKVVRSFVNCLETLFWKFFNEVKINRIMPEQNDIAVVYLRNHTDKVDVYISMLRNRGVKIVWLTSHFHLSYNNKDYINNQDTVCLDNKLSENIELRGNTIISPPVVSSRFKVFDREFNKRQQRVLCMGTVHMYKNKFLGSVAYNDFYTMHPSRCSLLESDDLRIEKNFSVITDNINLYQSQRAYMGGDLPSLYNSYRFAFIGSEHLGIAALGVYEAMSCGCEIFIEESVGKSLNMEEGVNAWFFNNTAESLLAKLTFIIENKLYLNQCAIKDFSDKYRSDFLYKTTKNIIVNLQN